MTGHEHITLSVDEGPALGAALLAAVGTGAYPTVADACRAAIRPVARVAPRPDAHAAYRRYNAIYRALYPALKAQFAAVSAARWPAHWRHRNIKARGAPHCPPRI